MCRAASAAVVLTVLCASSSSDAFKPYTHVYAAEEAWEDAKVAELRDRGSDDAQQPKLFDSRQRTVLEEDDPWMHVASAGQLQEVVDVRRHEHAIFVVGPLEDLGVAASSPRSRLRRAAPRPRLRPVDRAFWIVLSRAWSSVGRDARAREARDGDRLAPPRVRSRLVRDYARFYNDDQPHMALEGDTPAGRAIEGPDGGDVIALPRVGGLHHRYSRAA